MPCSEVKIQYRHCPDVTSALLRCQVEKSAFVVGDLGALMRQHLSWQNTLPQLQPYYPLRYNSSPAVVEVLASLGLGFVCVNKVCLRFARLSNLIVLVLPYARHACGLFFFFETVQSTSLIGRRLMTPSGYATPLGHFLGGFSGAFSFLFFPPLVCQAEISLVLEHGVPPESIILSGVCKQQATIKYAAKNNVRHLLCENEAELSKISRLHPDAK